MCGGTLEINNNETVAECAYCGTKQTIPNLDDEKRANLYDRANHFRRNNEFDKASTIYEQILNEDGSDAEAYWSLVLCRYGIEYVEDPASHKRVPTVNRAQFTSVFDDDNYKSALKHADDYQKSIYEEEAKTINEIQKGILAISQKEEPFDVFICYKESDNNGRRTPDSVLANDLYHQLTQEGFKVFFARITLEDKLGSAYEPYIFAALNSAKIMVVLGTKPEYFNAVWVKNEWSRFLALIKNGAKKMLIPAYKDMDPYDLPEEFSHLQAQDMSKLGFMQDLIRAVKKILQETSESKKQTIDVSNLQVNASIAPLLKRAFMFLRDGEWDKAFEYCEKVLDSDPENSKAYVGRLLSELHIKTEEELVDSKESFSQKDNFNKALQFADEEYKKVLLNLNSENIYRQAKKSYTSAHTEEDFKKAKAIFVTISGYKDADELAEDCIKKAEAARIKAIYQEGLLYHRKGTIEGYKIAISKFSSIMDYKDVPELIQKANVRIEEITRANKATEKKRTKIIAVVSIVSVFAIPLIIWWSVETTASNKIRAEKITANFVGKSFTYTEYTNDYIYKYTDDYIYEFESSGKVKYTEKRTRSKDNWNCGTSITTFDYSVSVSFGSVTVNIDNWIDKKKYTYRVIVDGSDNPTKLKCDDQVYE